MEKLSNSLDKVLIDMTVTQMLNPNNKDFYIGNLTLDKVSSLIDGDTYRADILFRALSVIEFKFPLVLEQIEYERAVAQEMLLEDIAKKVSIYGYNLEVCPECGCNTYIDGVRCPNCDHCEY